MFMYLNLALKPFEAFEITTILFFYIKFLTLG